MSALLPHGHPVRGIVLAELGKLLNLESSGESPETTGADAAALSFLPKDVKGRMALARETMIKALEELRVGFGKDDGMVAKEMEMLVEGLTREMVAMGVAR
jgi:SET and MYND domain-containing protein